MDLEIIILSELSDRQGQILYSISYMQNLKKIQMNQMNLYTQQ